VEAVAQVVVAQEVAIKKMFLIGFPIYNMPLV
jgi:hypothetical protein